MEVKELTGFTLFIILIGMLLGVGVIIFDNFGSAAYLRETITNENITNPAGNVSVEFGHNDLLSFSGLTNGSATISSSSYTVDLPTGSLNLTDNTTGCPSGGTCLVTYDYKKFGAATTSINATRDAVTPISSTWLPLIVTVAILSIILLLVVQSFGRPR